jgi:glycerone phosphate O-acyltransferase/fatty acyl-CoA reductase
LLKSAKVVRKKFGSIAVQFGQPIDMRNFVATRLQNDQAPDDSIVSTTALVQDLAYEITDSMISCATCTPSNLVATILLMYRHGMSRKDLIRQSDWLREEISKRGGRVLGTEGRLPSDNVNRALELLQELVMTRRKNFVEPAISNVSDIVLTAALRFYDCDVVVPFRI